MRRAFLASASAQLLSAGALLGCTPSVSPNETWCRPQTESELQAIAAGEVTCSSVRIAETSLEDLSGLRGLGYLAGGVLVFRNERLRDVTGLEDVGSVGQIDINENTALMQLDLGWTGAVGAISISGNNLGALALSLNTADSGLDVVDEPITSLTVSNPEPMRQLMLAHLPELDSLDGLSELSSVESVMLYDLPSLPADEVGSFLAGLDPAPGYVKVCDVEGYPSC